MPTVSKPNGIARGQLGCVVSAVAVLICAPSEIARAQSPGVLACGLDAGPERSVIEVLDGETLRLDDGKHVRLLGISAPRSRDVGAGAQSWPPEAVTRTSLSALVAGRTVALAFEGRREDRYGRVLAHVFLDDAGEKVWVQGRLIDQGLARAQSGPQADGCSAALNARERVAREAGRGLWANAAYAVRPGDRPTELGRYRGRWILVRGTVDKVGGTQSLVFVDLRSAETAAADDPGYERLRRVRITWRRSIDKSLALTVPVRRLRDRTVLIRGWLEMRGGAPEIELLAAGQLEVEPVGRAGASQEDPNMTTPSGEPAGRR